MHRQRIRRRTYQVPFAADIGSPAEREAPETHRLLDLRKRALAFLFDDVTFNGISFIDYFAGLIAAMRLGRHRHPMKWNTLVGHARHELSRDPIGLAVMTLHRAWLDRFYKFRSNLIHDRASGEMGTGYVELRPGRERPTVEIKLPAKLLEHLLLRPGIPVEKPTPLVAASLIAKNVMHAGFELVAALRVWLELAERERTRSRRGR